jgi:hypothetical protein
MSKTPQTTQQVSNIPRIGDHFPKLPDDLLHRFSGDHAYIRNAVGAMQTIFRAPLSADENMQKRQLELAAIFHAALIEMFYGRREPEG